MKLLTDIGVSAVHIGLQTVYEDVAEGKFRFGTENVNVPILVLYVKAI